MKTTITQFQEGQEVRICVPYAGYGQLWVKAKIARQASEDEYLVELPDGHTDIIDVGNIEAVQ